jgi:hypothetical protein
MPFDGNHSLFYYFAQTSSCPSVQQLSSSLTASAGSISVKSPSSISSREDPAAAHDSVHANPVRRWNSKAYRIFQTLALAPLIKLIIPNLRHNNTEFINGFDCRVIGDGFLQTAQLFFQFLALLDPAVRPFWLQADQLPEGNLIAFLILVDFGCAFYRVAIHNLSPAACIASYLNVSGCLCTMGMTRGFCTDLRLVLLYSSSAFSSGILLQQ